MGVDVLVERCAGLDVHRDTVVATVRVAGKRRGTRRGETRTFATTVAGLERLADWLVGEHAVTLVGMEATGVYWKPVFAVLEPRVQCWLLNAQHLHNVPGRKTDVADSVWIAQLVEHGLVRPSFIPPAPVRDLRDVTRLRTAITQERTRAIQRLEKVMQDAGIKLTSVASQAYSKTARAILSALLAGVTDPVELAGLAKGRLRSKTDRLVEALASRFRVTHHGVMVRRLLAHIDSLDEQLDEAGAAGATGNLAARNRFTSRPR
jgi:transposase